MSLSKAKNIYTGTWEDDLIYVTFMTEDQSIKIPEFPPDRIEGKQSYISVTYNKTIGSHFPLPISEEALIILANRINTSEIKKITIEKI